MFRSHPEMNQTHLFCTPWEGTSDGFPCTTVSGGAKFETFYKNSLSFTSLFCFSCSSVKGGMQKTSLCLNRFSTVSDFIQRGLWRATPKAQTHKVLIWRDWECPSACKAWWWEIGSPQVWKPFSTQSRWSTCGGRMYTNYWLYICGFSTTETCFF